MERIICNPVILKEVSTELGLPLETVKNIVNSQSEFTKFIIEQGAFDSVRWPYLGIFKSKPKEVQILTHLQGMTPEQQADFKHKVRTGKIKLNTWEKKKK